MVTLPKWAPALYSHQVKAIQEVLYLFSQGNQVVMLDAPTGSGKTLIAEMVRQNMNVPALYVCNSLSLQSQFARDFPSAAILMGRSNYATADNPSRFPELTARDCTKQRVELPGCFNCSEEGYESLHCGWCHPVTACPYEMAKATALRSSLVCTNTSYLLYEANYVGLLPMGRELIIIDEADTLEDVLLSFIEVSITERRAKEFGLPKPAKKTVESAWVDWALEAAQALKRKYIGGDSLEAIRTRQHLASLRQDIARLNDPKTGLSTGGWIYTGYDRGNISFKPIQVSHLAQDYLWQHGKRFLLMSATTISFDVMAKTLGFDL